MLIKLFLNLQRCAHAVQQPLVRTTFRFDLFYTANKPVGQMYEYVSRN
ncbi:unnamed protein product, partial [Tenebrio molitor]